MQLEFAFLADSAIPTPDGKFSVLGGSLGALAAVSFPLTHPVIALVARVLFEPEEAGRSYPFEIALIGPSDDVVGELATGPVIVPSRPEGLPDAFPAALGIVVNFPAVTFPEPGKYTFRITANSQKLAEVPLYVSQRASPFPSDSDELGNQ